MHPTHKAICLLLLLCNSICSFACINEYRAGLYGKRVEADDYFVPYARDTPSDTRWRRKNLALADSIWRATGSIKDRSDYGAQLAFCGHYAEAKNIFSDIEEQQPGLYATASNLGTVYELLGINDSALIWIRRAVQINPRSHHGSEWIHVKILEAKIAAAGDSNYYKTHRVLPVNFGTSDIPDTTGTAQIQLLQRQLYYQLCERMTFVYAPDPVVGQLLFELGNANAVVADVVSAIHTYEQASLYGYNTPLMTRRKIYFLALQNKAANEIRPKQIVKDNLGVALSVISLLSIACVSILILWVRRRKNA